jgi:hypothetical protein
MIEETIAKIEKTLQSANLSQDKRQELLALLQSLKQEANKLSETHSDSAHSILGFAQVSAHEATRKDRNSNLLKLSLDGLNQSVKEFEATHPQLVANVDKICLALSSMGI